MGLLLAGFALAGVLAVVGTAAFSVRRVRRAVRLVPQLPTGAPVSWLWRPQRPAQLHRRLRRTCRSVAAVLGPLPRRSRRWLRRSEPPASPLFNAAEELLEASAHLDRQLVLIGRLPGHLRRQVDAELVATVSRLEQVGERLVRVGLAWERQVTDVAQSSTQASLPPWPAIDAMDGATDGDGLPPLAAVESGRVEGLADRLTALEKALRDLRLLV